MGCKQSDLRTAPNEQSSGPNARPPPPQQQQRQPSPQPPLTASAQSVGKQPVPPPQQRQPSPVPQAASAPAAAAGGGGGRRASSSPSPAQSSSPAAPTCMYDALVNHSPDLPSVPPGSWYAKPLTENTKPAVSEFHHKNKGRVVYATRCIPTAPAELAELPQNSPVTRDTFDLGKDVIYGMSYLHNTALFIEHHWRTRVKYLQLVRDGKAPVPAVIEARQKSFRANSASAEGEKGGTGAAAAPVTSPTSSKAALLVMERGDSSVYQRPAFDTLLGFKVFVNNELVPDHYPGVKSLPQCTATLDANEAFTNWVCVPFVLIGYLNHLTLDPISMYRSLSLNFVEHLLHMKLPEKSKAPISLDLRVEVVYGCRAEAFFCTDFISRGSCTLKMSEMSKAPLKAYEEKLRALIVAKMSTEHIIRAPPPPPGRHPRTCPFCGHPLAFICTVCGAEYCGSLMCARHPQSGYPKGCSVHDAQPL